MNVNEITGMTGQEPLVHYVATTLILTCATVWIVIACQSHGPFPEDSTLAQRAGWPIFYLLKKVNDARRKRSLKSVRDVA